MPDERVWTGASGNSHPGQPITEEMLFDMGSAGKMLVAPLMLDLAEEGLISLDDPMPKWLRDAVAPIPQSAVPN
jgi:CubicO group peptidase (beta-lactamase class C family)